MTLTEKRDFGHSGLASQLDDGLEQLVELAQLALVGETDVLGARVELRVRRRSERCLGETVNDVGLGSGGVDCQPGSLVDNSSKVTLHVDFVVLWHTVKDLRERGRESSQTVRFR